MSKLTTVYKEIEATIELDDVSTEDLVEVLEDRGVIVLEPGVTMPTIPELADVITRRHAEHASTILTCTDEVCDAFVRFGGES